MTKSEAVGVIKMLTAYWPGSKLSQENVTAYCEMVLDLPAAATEEAVKELAATSKFCPSIAEIRSLVTARKLGAPTPDEAWSEVLEIAARSKRGGASHPLIDRAAELVGWDRIATTPTDYLYQERAAFIRAYEGLRNRTQHEEQVAGVLPQAEDRKRIASGEAVPVGSLLAGVVK